MYSKNTLFWSMRQVWFDEKQFPTFFVTFSSTSFFSFQDTSIDRKKLWPNRGIFRLQQPQWPIGRDPKELPEATHKVYLCTQLTQGKWILWDLSLRTHKSSREAEAGALWAPLVPNAFIPLPLEGKEQFFQLLLNSSASSIENRGS